MTAPLGCLILHGFTSSLDTVRALVPMVERLGLPYRMPILRGHGTRPEDLRGVTYRDWFADAAAALHDLREEADQVAVCGLSMGGLVALNIAAAYPHDVACVATIAAALRLSNRLIRITPLAARVLRNRMWQGNPASGYADPALVAQNTNYRMFPLDAVVSLYRYGAVVEQILPRVQAPLLVIHSRRDLVIKPVSAEIIYRRAGSHDKQLRWFERSGHEMLQDLEADAVVAAIENFIQQQRTTRNLLAHAAGSSNHEQRTEERPSFNYEHFSERSER
jgi:carboxylesterase